MEKLAMFKRHYLTGVLVFLSLTAGSAVASAAETGTKTVRHSSNPSYGYRGLYDYAGPPANYGSPWYDDQWDPSIWSTGNGYF